MAPPSAFRSWFAGLACLAVLGALQSPCCSARKRFVRSKIRSRRSKFPGFTPGNITNAIGNVVGNEGVPSLADKLSKALGDGSPFLKVLTNDKKDDVLALFMETLEKSPPDGEPIFDPEGRANFPVDLTVEADSEGYQCSATLKTVSFSLTSFSIEDLELGKGDGDTSLKFDCSFSFQHVGVSGSAQVSKDFKVGGFSLPSPFSLAEVRGGPAAQVAENGSSAARRNRSEGRRSSRAGITVDGEAKTRISGKFHFGMEGGVDSCDCEGTVCLAVHFDSLHLGVGEFELDQGNTTVTIDLPTGIPIGDLEERIQDFKHGIEDKIVEKLTDPEALPAIVNQFSESMSNTLQKLHFDLPCMKII